MKLGIAKKYDHGFSSHKLVAAEYFQHGVSYVFAEIACRDPLHCLECAQIWAKSHSPTALDCGGVTLSVLVYSWTNRFVLNLILQEGIVHRLSCHHSSALEDQSSRLLSCWWTLIWLILNAWLGILLQVRVLLPGWTSSAGMLTNLLGASSLPYNCYIPLMNWLWHSLLCMMELETRTLHKHLATSIVNTQQCSHQLNISVHILTNIVVYLMLS